MAVTRRARVVTWNGKDVPAELRELPAGRYVVESYRQGRVVDARRARQIIDAALGR